MSHPFVERLIGSVRRELLDHTLFWTVTDLENKLREYQCYYNEIRCHSGRNGAIPIKSGSAEVIDINDIPVAKTLSWFVSYSGSGVNCDFARDRMVHYISTLQLA